MKLCKATARSVKTISVTAAAFLALAASATVPYVAMAGTYTWIGGNSGTWDKATPNWSDGTTSGVAWVDGNDAVFSNTAAMTISIGADVSADNIRGTGGSTITFNGSSTLSWKGWLLSSGRVDVSCPVSDVNGTGLHFQTGGHVFLLNSGNSQVGGNFIRGSSSSNVRAFSLDGGDHALGPVPENPATNITIETTGMSLFVSNNKSVELHRNRHILIKEGYDLRISPQGPSLRIKGRVVGAMDDGGYPRTSRVVAHWYNGWNGLGILDPGEGNLNYFGRLLVLGQLEIASGTTRVVYDYTRSSSAGDYGLTEDTPLYIMGGNNTGTGYENRRGYLLISGGTLANGQNRHYQISRYGHLDIAGGTVTLSGELLNGLDTSGKITVRDGGMLDVATLRVSQCKGDHSGEVFLNEGGTVRCGTLKIDTNVSPVGTVHLNGGHLQSKNGYDHSTNFVSKADNAAWDNVTFAVEAGGAVFDTSNGKNLWWGRPLASGVASGAMDGGLKCLVAPGCNVVLDRGNVHSYNGPTRVESIGDGTGARMLQCRAENALPNWTTLVIGNGCQVAFNTWAGSKGSAEREAADLAQTVARVEGTGKLQYNSLLTVTGGIKPSFDGTYGMLTFEKPCTLSCTYEIPADADGCGCVKFSRAGQDISGLTLSVDVSSLDRDAARGTYKILDAPNGYSGKFAVGNLSEPWCVHYTNTAAYLKCRKGMMLVFR